MRYLLYLAGPIRGLSWDEATDWRGYVYERMPPHIAAVSPLRSKDYLSGESCLADQYAEGALSSQKGITTRDRWDVMRADAVFVNLLGAKAVSIGTVMEIAWADAFRKPIILCADEGGLHDHAMIREVTGFIARDLDDGIRLVQAILGPGR